MEVEMLRLNDEMYRLHDRLARERQNLAKSLDEWRSLVAPIRRIPQEILSEIFYHCVMDHSSCIESDVEPLLLTFVCRRWRRLAIFSPRLWSAIYLPYDRPSVKMLEIWLSRSGLSPLTLDVESENENNNVIHTLVPYSRRWHDVSLSLDPAQYKVLAAVAGNLPMLERLNLDASDDFHEPLAIFETAPRLRSVGFLRFIKPSGCQLPWLQLRNCQVFYSPRTEWYHLLRQCPYLTHCDFGIRTNNDMPQVLTTPVVHSHLRSLRLSLVDEKPHSPQFFNDLTLPALRDLDIALRCTCPIAFTPQSMSLFLNRSSCNLQRMSLRIRWTDVDLIIFLQELRSLVELSIFEGGLPMLTEQVLRRMTPDISGSSLSGLPLLVPKLKHLALSAHFEMNDQVILDMVHSRMGLVRNSGVAERSNQVESLESVALDITRYLAPWTISQMTFWQRSGLKVWVMSLGKYVVNIVDGSPFGVSGPG